MKNRPVFSQKISSHARNLISGLLKFNPKERFGAKVINSQYIFSHLIN